MHKSVALFISYVAVLLAAVLSASPMNAALLSSFVADGEVTILLAGEIVESDAATLVAILDLASGRGEPVKEVRLDSIGGSVFEAVNILRVIRAARLDTRVERGGTCASACFLIFAAGSRKYVGSTARIGVHIATDEFGKQDRATIEGTAAMGRIARLLQVPPEAIEGMRNTPATKMFWLSKSTLSSMGGQFF